MWILKAEEVSEPQAPAVPLRVLLEEAAVAAHFMSRYWREDKDLPGMCQAGPEVSEEIGREILELCRAVQEAQSLYLSLSKEKMDTRQISDRARFLLREFKYVTRWAFRLDGAELAEKRLRALRKSYRNKPKKAAYLAAELRDYASLITEYRKLVTQVESFDLGFVEEAQTVAKQLHSVRPGRPCKSTRCNEILRLRKQLTHLLMERVRLVRTAARFVFRNHPAVVREITSRYERRRRARSRAQIDL